MMTKVLDSKGRLALGADMAGRTVLVQVLDNQDILITPAAVIPERELWLYRNEAALSIVQQGLQEARDSQRSPTPPDLTADSELAADMDV
jgi:uncharacterized membrane protein (DUF4010 family)